MLIRRKIQIVSLLLGIVFSIAVIFGVSHGVYAQPAAGETDVEQITAQDLGLYYGEAIGLGQRSLQETIARIIRIALGLLGIIAVLIVIAGGVMWMTAGGSEEKVAKAKKILINGAIGLAIILSAYTITHFVIKGLTDAISGRGMGDGAGVDGGGFGFGACKNPPCAGNNFVAKISPKGQQRIQNVVVKINFQERGRAVAVDQASLILSDTVKVYKTDDRDKNQVAVELSQVSATEVNLMPRGACPEPNQDREECFEANKSYTVELTTGVKKSGDGRALYCPLNEGGAFTCKRIFIAGDAFDAQPPTVQILNYRNGDAVPLGDTVDIKARARDDFGVDIVQYEINGEIVFASDIEDDPETVTDTYAWEVDSEVYNPLEPVSLRAHARDVDGNSAVSDEIKVIPRPQHCFNREQDEDEEGLDCGGEWCGACAGAACQRNADCAGGFCRIPQGADVGVCVDLPLITGVDPADGAPGTVVTIAGRNFGDEAGQVVFYGADGNPVAAAGGACGVRWSAESITVSVPDGLEAGLAPIGVRVAGEEDRTDDDSGPNLNDIFTINDVARPGICEINPEEGVINDRISVRGVNLGGGRDGALLFGGQRVRVQDWQEDRGGQLGAVIGFVPNIGVGKVGVQVQRGEIKSNTLIFTVRAFRDEERPQLAGIDPARGPIGTYVTLSGTGFGNAGQGSTVVFEDKITGGKTVAGVDFPEACGDAVWTDRMAVVKVPQGVRQADFNVFVRRGAEQIDSNPVDFTVTDGSPAPGICKIEPNMRQVNGWIDVRGEYFGDDAGFVRFWTANAAIDDLNTWAAGNMGVQGSAWGAENGGLIKITVPVGAISGPVKVVRADQAESNAYDFIVGSCIENNNQCTGEQECCQSGFFAGSCQDSCEAAARTSEYSWIFSTGDIPAIPSVVECCGDNCPDADPMPSPTPWVGHRGSEQVCAEAFIRGTLTMPIDLDKGNPTDKFILERCAGPVNDPCNAFEEVHKGAVINNGAGVAAFEFSGQHTPGILPNNIYQVRILEGLWSISNPAAGLESGEMRENPDAVKKCGGPDRAAGTAYCYQFITGADECQIGAVKVIPAVFTARELGWLVADDENNVVEILGDNDSPLYGTGITAAGNQCVALDPANRPWLWGSSDNDYAQLQDLGGAQETNKRFVQAVKRTEEERPVTISAVTAGVTGSGSLIIAPGDPQIIAAWPQCEVACVNTQIGVSFNMRMDAATLGRQSVGVYKCRDELCSWENILEDNAAGKAPNLVDAINYADVNDSAVSAFEKHKARIILSNNLEKNSFYRVALSNEIISVYGVSIGKTSDEYDFQVGEQLWKSFRFRVRDDDSLCQIENVAVEPGEVFVRGVGMKQWFRASAQGEANGCGPGGGREILNAANMSWAWASSKLAVVTLQTFDVSDRPAAGCTNQCLLIGSSSRSAVCGNRNVDKGEDCDPPNGEWCTGRCLAAGADKVCMDVDEQGVRLPVEQCASDRIFGADPCGNGNVDNGEQCDDGKRCYLNRGVDCDNNDNCSAVALCKIAEGADAGLCPDGSICAEDGDCSDVCLPIGGDGCSVLCMWEGSSSTGVTCGNRDVAYGEGCDDGNKDSRDGCSKDCIKEGMPVAESWCDAQGNNAIERFPSCREAVAVCGNSTLESGEACDPPLAGVCTDRCLFAGGTEENCGNGVVDPGEECDGSEGCKDCLLIGSSFRYNQPSICGDGRPGVGEAQQCEDGRSGDGKVDPIVLATMEGLGIQEEIEGGETQLVTDITATATVEEATGIGSARFILQCGFTSDDQCPAGSGVGSNGCCYPFPVLRDPVPVGEGACRNPVLQVTSNSGIDLDSLDGNILIVYRRFGSCLEGEQEVVMDAGTIRYAFSPSLRERFVVKFKNFISRLFNLLVRKSENVARYLSGAVYAQEDELTIGDQLLFENYLHRAQLGAANTNLNQLGETVPGAELTRLRDVLLDMDRRVFSWRPSGNEPEDQVLEDGRLQEILDLGPTVHSAIIDFETLLSNTNVIKNNKKRKTVDEIIVSIISKLRDAEGIINRAKAILQAKIQADIDDAKQTILQNRAAVDEEARTQAATQAQQIAAEASSAGIEAIIAALTDKQNQLVGIIRKLEVMGDQQRLDGHLLGFNFAENNQVFADRLFAEEAEVDAVATRLSNLSIEIGDFIEIIQGFANGDFSINAAQIQRMRAIGGELSSNGNQVRGIRNTIAGYAAEAQIMNDANVEALMFIMTQLGVAANDLQGVALAFDALVGVIPFPVLCTGALRANYGIIINEDGSTTAQIMPLVLLEPDAEYKVRVLGGNDGVRDGRGVPLQEDFEWNFKTGSDVCTLDQLRVEPAAWMFSTAQEATGPLCVDDADCGNGGFCVDAEADLKRCDLSKHRFIVRAFSGIGDAQQELAPVQNFYDWTYEWGPTKDSIINLEVEEGNTSAVISAKRGESGNEIVIANAKITADIINDPSQKDREVTGSSAIIVSACERPWPPLVRPDEIYDGPIYPYEDVAGNDDGIGKAVPAGAQNIFTNFSTWYCMDEGAPTSTPRVTYKTNDDPTLIKRIHFVNDYNDDLIGIRVHTNPRWLTLDQWYGDHFPGQGKLVPMGKIDGFEAARLGDTVYVSAVNYLAPPEGDGSLFANIYIFSISGAGKSAPTVETKSIFEQMINNLIFTANVEQYGRCAAANNKTPVADSSKCTADADCILAKEGDICLADRDKLRRDLTRVEHARTMLRALRERRLNTGGFPTMTEVENQVGSFIPYFTTSKWPSWQGALGNTLGTMMPEDPVNKFVGCTDDFNPETCWNAKTQEMERCDRRWQVYQYRTNADGTEADIRMRFEFFGQDQDALMSRIRDEEGSGVVFLLGACATRDQVQGVAEEAACGNGVLDSGEKCEIGGIQFLDSGRVYLSPLPGQPRVGSLGTVSKYQVQACNSSCNGFSSDIQINQWRCSNNEDIMCHDDPNCTDNGTCNAMTSIHATLEEIEQQISDLAQRRALVKCGNGIKDEDVSEECDDGPLNGRYGGYCSANCKGYTGFCGDQRIEGDINLDKKKDQFEKWVELCDTPGLWAQERDKSCGWNCQTYGRYCGDGNLDANNNVERDGAEDEQCDDGNIANGDGCSMSCKKEESPPAPPAPRQPDQYCGNGIVEQDEICDEGRSNGQPCQADPGEQCAYCAANCKNVLFASGLPID